MLVWSVGIEANSSNNSYDHKVASGRRLVACFKDGCFYQPEIDRIAGFLRGFPASDPIGTNSAE